MKSFSPSWTNHWSVAAAKFVLMTAFIPAVVSYSVATWSDSVSKYRESRITQAAKFAADSNETLIKAAAQFVASVDANHISPSHKELREEIIKQVALTENVSQFFKEKPIQEDITEYKKVLGASLDAIDDASDPVKLIKWANSLSRVVDVRRKLVDDLISTSQSDKSV